MCDLSDLSRCPSTCSTTEWRWRRVCAYIPTWCFSPCDLTWCLMICLSLLPLFASWLIPCNHSMLFTAIDRRDDSRLACQIILTQELAYWLTNSPGTHIRLPRFWFLLVITCWKQFSRSEVTGGKRCIGPINAWRREQPESCFLACLYPSVYVICVPNIIQRLVWYVCIGKSVWDQRRQCILTLWHDPQIHILFREWLFKNPFGWRPLVIKTAALTQNS